MASKRKLKLASWGSGPAGDGNFYVTLYFNRTLSSLEQAGIVAVIKERLDDGK